MASEYLHPEVMVVPSHSACLKIADDAHVRARFWLQRICLIGRQLLTPLPCDVRHSHRGVCTRVLIWKKTGQQCPPTPPPPDTRTLFQTRALESWRIEGSQPQTNPGRQCEVVGMYSTHVICV